MDTQVWVYADWIMPDGNGFEAPQLIGELTSSTVRNKEHFSFSYASEWLNSPYALPIDPDLQLVSGRQYSADQNFRIFLDSCPDRWGRLLMKRRESVIAREEQRKPRHLNEIDYLLGVHDQHRMGGIRFKASPEGEFLDNKQQFSVLPIKSIQELEQAVSQIEKGDESDPDYIKWLNMLFSPGSSLGGARPKASVIDTQQSLWIAKFPSRYDDYDVAAWEYLAYQLALIAGVEMSDCKILRSDSPYHTFLSKRFDRQVNKRLHFTSAMTQLGYYDGDYEASYLELAEFLTHHGSQSQQDLEQLWRRIVFNIAVSNTDDHLRNHGFILDKGGWKLSPAYDINPVTAAQGLHLNIDESNNQLDFELAMDVIDYFRIKPNKAKIIMKAVQNSVRQWDTLAQKIGITREEQERMRDAFFV